MTRTTDDIQDPHVNYPNDITTYVYALYTVVDIYRYIGVTVDPRRRFRQHKNRANLGSMLPVHHWMRKYPEEIMMVILGTYDKYGQALEAEMQFIAASRLRGNALLNLTDGGEGAIGYTHSIESLAKMEGRVVSDKTKAKLREANLGIPLSSESIAKRTATRAANGTPSSMLGKHHTDETKAKMSAANTGRQRTDETKEKIGIGHIGNKGRSGQPHTEETKEKMRAAWQRRLFAAGKTKKEKNNAVQGSFSLIGNKRAAGKVLSAEGRVNLLIGNHVRWHVNRGITKSGCSFCEASDVK